MATNGGVNIPISLDVTDIQMGNIDLSDVEQSVTKELSKLETKVSNILSKTGGSTNAFNEALSKSYGKVVNSASKAREANDRYVSTLRKAGATTVEYEEALQRSSSASTQLATVNGKISTLKSNMKDFKDQWGAAFNSVPQLAQQYAQMEQELRTLEGEATRLKATLPKAEDFAKFADVSQLTKIQTSYNKLYIALTSADTAQQKFDKDVENNKFSDEYEQDLKLVEKLKNELQNLNEKANKMNALSGANDHQWASIEYDVNSVSSELGSLISRMRTLVKTGAAFRFGAQGNDVQDQLAALKSASTTKANIKRNVTGMANANMSPYTTDYKAKLAELDALEKKIASVKAKSDEMAETGASASAWEHLKYQAGELEGELEKCLEELQDMINAGKAFRLGNGDTAGELDSVTQRVDNLSSTLGSVANQTENVRITSFRSLSLLSGAFTSVNSGINKVAGSIRSLVSHFSILKKIGAPTVQSINKSIKGSLKNITMYVFGFRSLFYLVKQLRSTLVSGLNTMAKQFTKVDADITTLNNSFRALKASLATAFQPIMSYIVPVLNTLIQTLTKAMNAIASFFAVLTGQNYIYKATAANEDYAASLDGTASSAKDANKQLGEYDKLLVIDQDTASSGGSGGGDTLSGITYDEAEVDGAISKFAEMVKKAWANADFTEVGEYLGQALLNALEVANNWLLTAGMAYAEKIGKSLGTLINGFVSVQDLAATIGSTIANAFNVALTGIDTFLTTTNWSSVGQFIADGMNSAILTANWSLIGKTVADAITAAVNSWWSFLTTFDFSTLGTEIGTAIQTAVTSLVVPDETGLTVIQKLGQSISNAVDGIITTISTALNTVDWVQVGQAIGQFISSIDWAQVTWDFTQLVASAVAAIAQAFAGWAETSPISAALVTMLGTAVMGAQLAAFVVPLIIKFTELKKAIGDIGPTALGTVKTIAQVFGGILLVIAGLVLSVGSFFDMWNEGFSLAKEAVMLIGIAVVALGVIVIATALGIELAVVALPVLIVAAIVAAIATIILLIHDNWDAICEFFAGIVEWIDTNMIQPIIEFFRGLWDSIVAIISPIVEWLNTNIIQPIVTFVTEFIAGVKLRVSQFCEGVKILINALILILKSLWEGFKTVIYDNIIAPIQDKWNNFCDTVHKKMETIVGKIREIWNKFYTFIYNNIIKPISDKFNSLADTVKSAFETAAKAIKSVFEGIVSVVKGVLNSLIALLEYNINSIIIGINNLILGFNTVVGAAAKLTGTSWSGVSYIPTVALPRLAQGAVIPPNKEFMAVLGDQKSGTNIEAPLDTIKQALAEVLAETGSNNQPIVLQLNGKTVAKVVWDEERKRYKQTGNTAYA